MTRFFSESQGPIEAGERPAKVIDRVRAYLFLGGILR